MGSMGSDPARYVGLADPQTAGNHAAVIALFDDQFYGIILNSSVKSLRCRFWLIEHLVSILAAKHRFGPAIVGDLNPLWFCRREWLSYTRRDRARTESCVRCKNRRSSTRKTCILHRSPHLRGKEDDIEQRFGIGLKVLVHPGFALLIDDANVHFSCMQIDAAIKFVLLIVKSNDFASFFCSVG